MQRRSFLATPLLSAIAAGASAEATRLVEQDLLRRAAEGAEQHRKGDGIVRVFAANGRPLEGAAVTLNQLTHEFLFGCIIFPLTNPRMPAEERELFARRYLEIFNLGVFPFYWASYEREPGKTAWRDFEPVVDWCAQNGVTTKGHPLVWTHPAGVPKWLSRFPSGVQEQLLDARVINPVGGFAGRIDLWDVVNEMIHGWTWEKRDVKGAPPAPAEVADYAEKALRWAHLANPDATLLLNEYEIVADAARFRKSEVVPRLRFLNLVDELQRRQAPRFEVGFQAHEPREEWFAPRNVLDACDAFGKRGCRVHMTELIPQSSGKPITGGWRTGAWTEDAQAEFADQFIRLAFGHPAVASVNFWGLSDRDIWLPKGGLTDEKYEPKPIYRAVRRLVREEWMTRNLAVPAASDGAVRFRGFFGKYQVRISPAGGHEQTFELRLTRDGPRSWEFRLAG